MEKIITPIENAFMDKPNDKKNEKKGDFSPASGEAVDRLLDNLEKELSSIETQEIVKGFTNEELEDKGFIGDKKLAANRPARPRETNQSGLIMEEAVEYAEKTDCRDISDVDIEELESQKDVGKGQVIASIKPPSGSTPDDCEKIAGRFTAEYQKKANVELKIDDAFIRFIATIKGKAVLLCSLPYIVLGDRDARCEATVSSDKMKVEANFIPSLGRGKPLGKQDVLSLLEGIGIKAGIREVTIAECVDHCALDRQTIEGIVIAEGKMPIDGKSVEPDLSFSTDPTLEDFKILPDGRIDYHKKANIQIVKKGNIVARIGSPQKGLDGFDVTGAILTAKEGSIRKLIAGENVRMSEDGHEFIAEAEGQVSLNGDVINVYNHYQVNGDVDFSVGNIDFNGNVTVKGMVLPGFEVKATGHITIMKSVESAQINAGGNLKVFGGIIGGLGGDNPICCGGSLYAHHLQNALVESQGDVHVVTSCVQSAVYCNGKVLLRGAKGVIIGGLVNALGGVEAEIIGTEFGTKTEIVVGKDFLIQKTVKEIKKALEFQYVNIQRIDKMLAPLLDLMKKGMLLSEEKKEKLKLIVDKRKQIKKSVSIMENKMADIEKQALANTAVMIKVRGALFPDVTVRIKEKSKQIDQPTEHVSIIYNKKHDDIEIGPY